MNGNTEKLSSSDSRFIFIQSQFLPDNKSFKDKNHLLGIIDRIGYVQIDTISVVERSHHHILWSRMPAYRKIMLDELIGNDKTVFEYWSHAAAYLPMKDFRFSLIRKNNFSKKHKTWGNANKKIIKYVYDRIKNEGELQSKDFIDKDSRTGGWWNWKPSKDALDFLFHKGDLMIAKRKGFQKVYDLTEKVLPANAITAYPTEKEFYAHLIDRSVRANGPVTEREITYLIKYNRKLFSKTLNEMIEDGKILNVCIEGTGNEVYYITNEKLGLLKNKKELSEIHILSPFDNLVIQRRRLNNFFTFDYTIECYVPEAKRKFGYFCMPILHGDRFIGRIDAKASREDKTFIIKKIFWEDESALNNKIIKKLEKKLTDYALFTGCERVEGIYFPGGAD